MVVALIKQGVYLDNPPQIFIETLVLTAKYAVYKVIKTGAPDWVKLLAGGNPELGDELLDEVRRWERVERVDWDGGMEHSEPQREVRLVHPETGRVAEARWSPSRWWGESGWDVSIFSNDQLVATYFKAGLSVSQIRSFLYTRGYRE
jgi:hypothetical protein